MNRRLPLIACLLWLCPAVLAQDVKARADELLRHAHQLEDIRSPNSPPFRLEATFSFTGDDFETVQGTYTELWVSNSQWRRETVVGDAKRIEIGGVGKRWLVYPQGFPPKTEKLPDIMTMFPAASARLAFDSIKERQSGSTVAECAIAGPAVEDRNFVFCFDQKSGVLLEGVVPERRPKNVVTFSCEYGAVREFAAHWFPRDIACWEDRHQSISARVVEISTANRLDSSLFTPPGDAIELGVCSGKIVPPVLYAYAFITPWNLDQIAWLRSWLVVDAKGKPKDLRLLRSFDKASYAGANNILRSLSFKAGTCDGQPMPMAATIFIPFLTR
jgi:hypothetical protein